MVPPTILCAHSAVLCWVTEMSISLQKVSNLSVFVGKVDTEGLLRIYHQQRQCLTKRPCDLNGLRQTLQRLWQVVHCSTRPPPVWLPSFSSDSPPPIGQDSLGLPSDQAIDEEANYLLSGGDSLKALYLCEDLLTAVGASSAELLEVLLGRSFADVLHHVACVIMSPLLESGPQGNKRPAGDPAAVPAKRDCDLRSAADEARAWTVVRRAGEVTNFGASEKSADAGENPADLSFALQQRWTSDTGRCVDASPVLLVHGRMGRTMVFIGSHSHRFQALDLASGSCVWERILGDRIESSAAVTLCGRLVVVGQRRLPFAVFAFYWSLGDWILICFSVFTRLLRRLCVFPVRKIWSDPVDVSDKRCSKELPGSRSPHRSGDRGVT